MSSYLLAYTLGEHTGAMTSDRARKAFRDTLLAEGFAAKAVDSSGVLRTLPDTTLVGDFKDDAAVKASVLRAMGVADAADPGKMFLTHHVLTPYQRVSLSGPKVITTQPGSQSTLGSATKAAVALARLKISK